LMKIIDCVHGRTCVVTTHSLNRRIQNNILKFGCGINL
jgi:hypothetical protein